MTTGSVIRFKQVLINLFYLSWSVYILITKVCVYNNQHIGTSSEKIIAAETICSIKIFIRS